MTLVKCYRSTAGQMAGAKQRGRSDESACSSVTTGLLARSSETAPQSLFRNDSHDPEFAEEVSGSRVVSRARIFAQGLQHRTRTDDDQEDYETESPSASGTAQTIKADRRKGRTRSSARQSAAI